VGQLAEWFADVEWWVFWSIPAFTAVIGILINWTGLIMLFSPVRFHGVTVPGLRELSSVLPHKVQEVPGLMLGGIGWQGIIPARAAKMGSIAVDKAISKLGTPAEFYQNLEPDRIAEHIVELFGPELPELIEEVMRDEHPALWGDLPPAGRRQVAPEGGVLVAHDLFDELGELGAEQLYDVLGDPVRLEILIELRGRAELGDRLVDGDGAHLGGAGGDDPLPADAAQHQAGDLLHLVGQHRGQLPETGHGDAVEADRAEQHDQAGPVDENADHGGEGGDRPEDPPLDVGEPLGQLTHPAPTSSPSIRSADPR